MTVAPRLRIALLLHLAPRKLGSIETWLVALAGRLRRRGHRVTVFTREPVHPAIAAAFEEAGVCWESLDLLRSHPFRAVLRLRQFDVAHLSFLSAHGRIALIGFLAWPTRILIVDHISRDDARLPAASQSTVHPGGIVQRVKRSFMAVAARLRLAGLAAVSDYVRQQAVEELGVPEDRLITIYNGIDLDRFRADEVELAGPPRSTTILTVAHLIPAKGIEYLLRAVSRIGDPSVRLRIVGDGRDRSRLEVLASDLGIHDRIEFCGLRDDVEKLLRTADMFVHPAVWGEAFGLAIAEAMASGCPVVASRVGGIPELIQDGESGLLVEPADADGLADAIARLMGDAELRDRLAANALSRVRAKFSLEGSARAHADWCENAVVAPVRHPISSTVE